MRSGQRNDGDLTTAEILFILQRFVSSDEDCEAGGLGRVKEFTIP
jgi:hypothetical protein